MNTSDYEALVKSQAMLRSGFATEEEELAYWSLCLNGEAGEVANDAKKVWKHGQLFDPEKVVDELGDVLWYLTIIALRTGASLEDIMNYNARKLSTRYPEGFKQGQNVHNLHDGR